MQLLDREDVNLSERFAKKWESKKEKTSFTESLKGTISPAPALKPRLDYATKRLEIQLSSLDRASERFNEKDKMLFSKLVDAYTKHDTAHANIYANELAEVRKMARLTMNARLALDQVMLRLRTCTEFGDLVANLAPAIGVLRSVGSCIPGVIPEAESELGEIGNMLSGIMFDAGSGAGMTMNFNNVNEDTAKILAEAAAVAEQKITANFPELPSGIAANASSLRSQDRQS